MSRIEIFKNDIPGGGSEIFKFVLPDGTEAVNANKNRNMNLDALRPHMGQEAVLHMYSEGQLLYSEEIVLDSVKEGYFGGHCLNYTYKEDMGKTGS